MELLVVFLFVEQVLEVQGGVFKLLHDRLCTYQIHSACNRDLGQLNMTQYRQSTGGSPSTFWEKKHRFRGEINEVLSSVPKPNDLPKDVPSRGKQSAISSAHHTQLWSWRP